MALDQPQEDSAEERTAIGESERHGNPGGGTLRRFTRVARGVRSRVRARPGGALAWRIGIAAAGLVVVVIGAVLLVLPGPGWAIIFLGLGIWATEFAWARSLLSFAVRTVRKWSAWIGRQPRWLALAAGAAGLLAIAAVVWLLTD